MISRKYPSTRLRRLRQSESIIDLISECAVTKNDLIQPVFVKEGLSDKEPIESMPGIFRFGEDSVLKEIEEISRLGIRAIAIFPVIDPSKKDSKGTEAIKRDNFISRVLGSIKSKFPEMLVIADVALDPYTDHGHDGILENDEIINDQTLDVLAEQSLVLAEAGADILFIESPESVDEMERICASFDAPLLVNVVDGGSTPVLSKQEYIDLGYQVAIYPGTGFLACAHALNSVYGTIKETGSSVDVEVPLRDFMTMAKDMGFQDVWDFDKRHEQIQ